MLQWCCMEIISLCFERVIPLGFLACHHKWRKMADGGAATVCTVFHVYSLMKCLYVRLCLWSVWHPSFLLLFWAGSQQVNIVFHYFYLKGSVHHHTLSILPWLCPFNIFIIFIEIFFSLKKRKKVESQHFKTRLKHTKSYESKTCKTI